MLSEIRELFKSKTQRDRDNFCQGYTTTMRQKIMPEIVPGYPKNPTQKFLSGCERAEQDFTLNNARQKARINQLQTDLTHAKTVESMLRERIEKAEDRLKAINLKANGLA